MFDKLEKIEKRYQELEAQLADAKIIADQAQYQKLAKEYAGLTPAVEALKQYRQLTGQRHGRSTLHYEFPTAEGDPYYPVPRPANRRLYERYAALAAGERNVTFVGRLARYQYLNMDQVVGQALASAAKLAPAYA